MILRSLEYQTNEKQYHEIFNSSCAALELQRGERSRIVERSKSWAGILQIPAVRRRKPCQL